MGQTNAETNTRNAAEISLECAWLSVLRGERWQSAATSLVGTNSWRGRHLVSSIYGKIHKLPNIVADRDKLLL
jgi:hypothetical protein